MFCFQSPFLRSSQTSNSPVRRKHTTVNGKSSSPKNDNRRNNNENRDNNNEANMVERRKSETLSVDESSVNRSIKYIDQEHSISSSTDTLPGIRTDYLEPEPLSPVPDTMTLTSSDLKVVLNDKTKRKISSSSSSPPSTLNNSFRWKKNFLSRFRSTANGIDSGIHKEQSSTTSLLSSSSCSSSIQPSSDQEDEESSVRTPLAPLVVLIDDTNHEEWFPENGCFNGTQPHVQDEDEEEEEEDDDDEDDDVYNAETETETEDAASLPSSPANAASTVAPNNATPYYDFLTVNGTGRASMRQETTSTSSPQLSTGLESSNNEKSPSLSSSSSLQVEDVVKVSDDSVKIKSSLDVPGINCSLPAARSCPNLERQSANMFGGISSPAVAGPRFKPLEEGDIQVCYLNHTKTLVRKILSSKFLRRWETHHLYLNDACLSSKTLTGFMQHPVPYSSMSEVRKYAMARWDPTYKHCLSIVLPEGSLLLQASNPYTRDQWYHSILWKKNIFKYQHIVSLSTREEVILRELRSMVDFALWTPLQDERVAGIPLEAVSKLLEEPITDDEITDGKKYNEKDLIFRSQNNQRDWGEAILSVAAPLLEKAAPPPSLARALARLAQQHPRSLLVPALSPAITRCLKHTVDFGKSPDMRKLIQVFLAALYENNDGEQAIRDYISYVHGPGSDCPHPRVLPNLVSVCVAAIFHRFEAANRYTANEDSPPVLPPLACYLLVLNVASEYADWRPGFGALLQPVPFPEEALCMKEVQQSVLLYVMRCLAKDSRCTVHRVLLPVREPRPGWLHVAAPSSPACPDQGELFGEMLTTLLGCCCRRKRFIGSLMKQAGDDCILLAVRGCDAAQEALCLMLEWRLLPNEEARLQVVNALESTPSGKNRYAALCQRQKSLQELQQKGGPKKLSLPVRATDADVALLLGGRALGNLECLSLAFTSVTSACAEQLIKLPALRYLNLWATQFGDSGLQMISEHLQKLQVLNLCETPVSDKGISTLVSLTSLKKLNLNSTKLSAQTFESLKKRLPSLQEFDVRYTEAW